MLDVNGFHHGIEEVKSCLHPREGRKLESLRDQRRVAAKWDASRAAMRAMRTQPRDWLDRWRLRQVMELVDHAYAFHPYYHEIYKQVGYEPGAIVGWSDFEHLPVIGKDDVIDNFDAFKEAVRFVENDIYYSRTSGSAGRILTIMQDPAASDTGVLCYLRHYEEMLGTTRADQDWVYEIYLAPPRITSLEGKFPVFTISQDCSVGRLVEHLALLRPAIITGFPSYLSRMVESGLALDTLGVRAICTNSEASSEDERRRIAQAFGCPVFDEYSSEELYLIATQCRQGRYHIVEDNVHLEAVDTDGDGTGISVGTSLVNRVMPFIRYRQGDVIRIAGAGERCACGDGFRQLEAFSGRADQQLVDTTGHPIGADKVMALYDRLLIPKEAGIQEFRIHQDATGAITVLAVPAARGGLDCRAALAQFCSELPVVAGDLGVRIDYKILDELPQTQSYKRRQVICEVAR